MSLKLCIFFLVGMGTNAALRLLSAGNTDKLVELIGLVVGCVLLRFAVGLGLCFDLVTRKHVVFCVRLL